MTDLTLAALTDEVRRLNTEKGWRAEQRSVRELAALIVSEISEALDAYRRWERADATKPYDSMDSDTGVVTPAKPEGVGAELADVIIRTVDACDILGRHLNGDLALADLTPLDLPDDVHSFTDHLDWLTDLTQEFKWDVPTGGPWLLRAVATVAQRYGIDLTGEVRRKMDHNWTRPFRHGNKLL